MRVARYLTWPQAWPTIRPMVAIAWLGNLMLWLSLSLGWRVEEVFFGHHFDWIGFWGVPFAFGCCSSLWVAWAVNGDLTLFRSTFLLALIFTSIRLLPWAVGCWWWGMPLILPFVVPVMVILAVLGTLAGWLIGADS